MAYRRYHNESGYIAKHRYIMAQELGRILNPGEIVHHRDGNRLNNNISNLELTKRGKLHQTSYTEGVACGMLLMLQVLAQYDKELLFSFAVSSV